jgi:hypothetical protein
LTVLLPGGFEPRNYGALLVRNLSMMAHSSISYSPILSFGLPLALAVLGYGMSDRFARISVWFSGFIALIQFVSTNFEEVRAEQMFFPLLAPAAVYGLRRVLSGSSAETQATNNL